MKLFYSPTSPYVRKVMAVAIEKGLDGSIEKLASAVSPVARDANVVSRNPLGKVPCAILDDGRVLYDSRVIAAYIDSLKQPALNPSSGGALLDALTLEALADGMLDAGLLIRYETFMRPEALRWADWQNGQLAKINAGLNTLEAQWTDALNGPVTIGSIAVGCALGWISFRLTDLDWRATRPRLAAWEKTFGARSSMQATAPKA